jgi:hypothetical protein
VATETGQAGVDTTQLQERGLIKCAQLFTPESPRVTF